jgi:putative endonuclease
MVSFTKNKRAKGNEGERIAEEYLRSKGHKILERNYRFQRAEIDLITQDGNDIVFIEVKTRHSLIYGQGVEAIDERKCSQLRKAAEGYLFRHRISNRPCRFDVVSISITDNKPNINHFKNAFQ